MCRPRRRADAGPPARPLPHTCRHELSDRGTALGEGAWGKMGSQPQAPPREPSLGENRRKARARANGVWEGPLVQRGQRLQQETHPTPRNG